MNELLKNNSHSSAKKIDKYHYNLHDILGQGSFATVYLSKDIETQELRAVKVINTSSVHKDQDIMLSLINEIKILKSLDNPNIIKCYDVLSTPNNTYLIMDYCEGGDLKSYLKKYMRLAEDRALLILKQILNGYRDLLKNGIIHRDIKAENILIKNDIFKIGDFGFAKILNNIEKDVLKSLVGTPLYMSPQIFKQEDYTSKSDIWAIGILYYEMLFGKTPWASISDNDLLKKMLTEKVEFQAGIFISEFSKNFIEGCLQVDENQRLSWEEVYSHELFQDCFNYRRRRTIFETKVTTIGARLGNIAKTKNIDIWKLYNSLDINENGKIEIDEFRRLLTKIDESLTREQMEYIFNRVDADNNNYIDFDEFEKWLASEEKSESDTTMTNSSKIDRFQVSLTNVQQILQNKLVVLEEAFQKNAKKYLFEDEFLLFLKKIDNTIADYDLKEIFKRVCGVDKAVHLETLRNILKEEKITKYRFSESQSPILTRNFKEGISKTQSFHSDSTQPFFISHHDLSKFKN